MRYLKSRKIKPDKVVIYYDDREKQPWMFFAPKYKMVKKRLDVGDYTIKGFEKYLSIEKKSGLLELLSCLTGRKRKRFKQFLLKLSRFPVKAIFVCKPLTNGYLQYTMKLLHAKTATELTDETIYYWIAEIMSYYRIPIIFLDAHLVQKTVMRMIEQVLEKR